MRCRPGDCSCLSTVIHWGQDWLQFGYCPQCWPGQDSCTWVLRQCPVQLNNKHHLYSVRKHLHLYSHIPISQPLHLIISIFFTTKQVQVDSASENSESTDKFQLKNIIRYFSMGSCADLCHTKEDIFLLGMARPSGKAHGFSANKVRTKIYIWFTTFQLYNVYIIHHDNRYLMIPHFKFFLSNWKFEVSNYTASDCRI